MNRQSLVAKMLHLQVASALVCILLYFALLFATRAGLSYYNNHSDIQQRSIVRQVERFQNTLQHRRSPQKTPGQLMIGWGSRAFC